MLNAQENWNDYRFFLTVVEVGTFAKAADLLQVDETTVARRILELERATGSTLFEARGKKKTLTSAGLAMRESLRSVRSEIERLRIKLSGQDQSLKGPVRITMADAIASHWFIPRLSGYTERYPEVTIELTTSTRIFDLSRREADIAIRVVRPQQKNLVMRKLGSLQFACYASNAYLEKHGRPRSGNLRDHSLVDYSIHEALNDEIACLSKLKRHAKARVLVNTRHSQIASTQAGLGIALLPCFIVEESSSPLVRLDSLPMIQTDFWMVTHSEIRSSAKIRSVADYVYEITKPFRGGA